MLRLRPEHARVAEGFAHSPPGPLRNRRPRLDVFNGLLLAPHLDTLFDAGLMTVDAFRVAQRAAKLTAERYAALSLNREKVVDLHAEHRVYLDFHRLHVWAG